MHGLHKRAYLGFEFQVAYPKKNIGSNVFYMNMIRISKFGQGSNLWAVDFIMNQIAHFVSQIYLTFFWKTILGDCRV